MLSDIQLMTGKEKPNTEPNYKLYFWSFVGFAALLLLAVAFDTYKKNQARKIKEAEYARSAAARQQQVMDSIAVVNRNKATYAIQLRQMKVRDSAYAELRYGKGDVVYLKPDSVRGCIWGIESDSMMFNYSYYIIVANEGQDPKIYKREDKMLY